jgi:uncharacterized protein (TIGR03437 family)
VNLTSAIGSPSFYAPLVQGTDGNFYGTATLGTVFKMTPGGAFTTLYKLGGGNPEGGLIQGTDGNLYGTTRANLGTVFKITPGGTFTALYSNGSLSAEGSPGGLIQATDGNFYGTTGYGGGSGSVFKLTPTGTLTTLHNFGSTLTDGTNPFTGLIQATDGNFYATTAGGGASDGVFGQGTIFKINPAGVLTTLYSFGTTSTDGSAPHAGLLQATDGNFYGTTAEGGAGGQGTVFKITPTGTLTTLYNFCAQTDCTDGSLSQAALVQASDGNFYGTTENGGASGLGTVFKITPTGTLTTLYSFGSTSTDGGHPLAALVQGSDGSLYGTTSGRSGAENDGTIFRLQLPSSGAYTCTNTTPPVITSVDSASAYGGYSYFASGSWLEIKGTNMADSADPRLSAATNPGQWTSSDFNGVNAPTSLDGISVSINGKPAYVWYLSPGQLNVQAPEDAATGSIAITVTNCKATSPAFMFARRALAPGFLAPSNYIANGTQYMIATFASDGAYVLDTSTGAAFGLNSRPAKPGDLIIAYGIGFGDVTPSILPGVIVGQSNALANPITLSFGSTPATFSSSGLAGGFVGLYEFYISVPSTLANGDYQINVMQNGTTVPQTLYLTVHN